MIVQLILPCTYVHTYVGGIATNAGDDEDSAAADNS